MPTEKFHSSKGVPIQRNQPLQGFGQPGRPTTASRYAAYKRPGEFILAAVLLVFASPVILLAMLAVKLTSRGPAVYTQTRLGRNGRRFAIHKIRTMLHECESESGIRWRFLRRTHIDELPQLWDVLKGDMGLVGPRPERPEIIECLQRAIPNYNERLLVRPGMTGLAQVQLPPDNELDDVRRKLRYDLYYLREQTLVLDLKILVCTACYLACIPFPVSKRWLGVPGAELVEQPLQPSASEREFVLQVQSA
jgi:lipopolysaccharide/colanic/teichoic acid biosynthesis glycosyltransferase